MIVFISLFVYFTIQGKIFHLSYLLSGRTSGLKFVWKFGKSLGRFKPPTLQMTVSQFATPVIDVILGELLNRRNFRSLTSDKGLIKRGF